MNPKIDFFFDFETRSRVDLKEVGAHVYATHPSTEATLITWCFGRTGLVKEWRKGQPIPQELIDVARKPSAYLMIAHNIGFDFLIWTQVFANKIPGYARPSIEDLEDNMAVTSHFRAGGSLDTAASVLKLPYNKDPIGRRLMLKQCKPNNKGEFYELTAAEWDQFSFYGKTDTRLLRDTYYMCPRLPAGERWAWEWTFIRNMRGIRIDLDLLNELSSIVQENLPKLEAEFNECVSWAYKMNSPKLKDFFAAHYDYCINMQSDSVDKMLADTRPVPAHVRRALEIKSLAGSTSITKLSTAMSQQINGRMYGLLAYSFAQTKRWAGRGIQIQNFPRPDDNALDSIKFDMNLVDLTAYVRNVRPNLKDPIGFVKNLLRRIWIPDEGKEFLCGDFSKIEPSTLFWLLGLGPIPEKWYEETAAAIYSMPVTAILKDSIERQVGKMAALACGYGCGADNFKLQVEKQAGIKLSDEDAKKAIYGYRSINPRIVQFWADVETAFRKAIYGNPTSLCNGKVHVMPMPHPHKGVQIRLPSGGMLYYHQAHVGKEQYQDKRTGAWHERDVLCYEGDDKGVYGIKKVYGGLLTEHVVSATSRDILVPAMWRLEQRGFEVLTTVHDELWAQTTPGRGEEFRQVMCISPSWCDMKINADFKNGVRYLK